MSQDISEMCDLISRQTDYNQEEIERKLKEHNYEAMNVIKEYITGNKKTTQKTHCNSNDIQQEIYRQLRSKLEISTTKMSEISTKN